MLLTSDLAVMDHWEGSVLLIANAINHNDLDTGVDEAYADAVARLDAMQADLSRPVAQPPAALPPSELPEYTALWGGPDFQEAVEDIKERIRAGEAFQVVPSQRFETPCTASALGRLPGPAGHQPVPVHVPVPLRRLRRRRLLPRGPGQGRGRARDGPPHRRHPAPRRHPAGGPGPRRRAARRPQGARRAPDARRPGPQRPGPGLRAGLGRGRRLHVRRAVLARDAHRVHRHRPGRGGPYGLRRPDRLLPRRHPLRRPQAARHADHRRAGALPPRACTAAASATSTSRATPTPPSPSARHCCATARRTSRPAPASSPTPTPSPRTPSAATRRRRSCARCTRRTGSDDRALLTSAPGDNPPGGRR